MAVDREGFICCITLVSELTRTLSKLEERIVKRERIIEEKGNEIEKLHKVIQNLEMVSNSEYFKIYVFVLLLLRCNRTELSDLGIQIDQSCT